MRFSFLLSFQTGPVIQILIVTIVNTTQRMTHHRNDNTNNHHRHRYRYHRKRQWYTTILLYYNRTRARAGHADTIPLRGVTVHKIFADDLRNSDVR